MSTSSDVQEVLRDQAGRRRLLILGAVFVAVVLVFGVYRVLSAGEVSTDDAIVDADVVPVSVMVGGQIAQVVIADNTRVKKGDVILQLDTVEIQARVQQAEGELAAAQAQAAAADAQVQVAVAAARGGLSSARAQVNTSRAQVSTAEAQIASAQAQLARAHSDSNKASADLDRARRLLEANAITQERFDALQALYDASLATVTIAEGQLAAAQDGRSVAQSRVAEAGGLLDSNTPIDAKIASAQAGADLAHARVTTASAALDLARLALTRATVVAPADGVVSKLSARVGQVLVQGQQIAFLVPDQSYVVANFKENQVGEMRPGQRVEVEVDSYPGHSFEGVLESISAGTGSRFSVLAPDNASGNFVKVVQRVPVRIQWKVFVEGYVLRPGMSAVVTVHTE